MAEWVSGSEINEQIENDAILELVREVMVDFLYPKPRLVCVCDDFKPEERDLEYCFDKCQNCGGWMSHERIVNNG